MKNVDSEEELIFDENKYKAGISINDTCSHHLPYVQNYIEKYNICKKEPMKVSLAKKLSKLHLDNEIALELYYK